jgi:hypothetical protein
VLEETMDDTVQRSARKCKRPNPAARKGEVELDGSRMWDKAIIVRVWLSQNVQSSASKFRGVLLKEGSGELRRYSPGEILQFEL